jgi:hypothetical protein
MGAEPARRPLAESAEPWTIRVKPSVKKLIEDDARRLGLDPAEFGRDCLVMGASVLRSLADGKAYIRVLA